jgi:hypothetical protein
MTEKDVINICSIFAGWIAGIAAVLLFLALRRRLDLWSRYINYAGSAGALTMGLSHWMAWYGLLVAIPAGGLVFLAIWMDSRKKFPR